LATAQQTKDLAAVKAPVAGVIRASSMAPGAQGGTLTLGGGRQLVSASVSEYDITKVKRGDSVNLTYSALNSSGTGKVLFVGQQPDTASGTKTYTVVVDPTNMPDTAALGMSVTATIMLGSKTNVLSVPSSAVVTSAGQSTVEVVDAAGQVTVTQVTIGLVGDSSTEVTAGLKSGDKVVIGLSGTVTSSTTSGGNTRGGFGGGPGGFGG
jgi:multidrug efflux pump subunit AcrA (membrane-fusion protein)